MLESLVGLKDFRQRVQWFIKEVDEPAISGDLMANGIRVSKIQFPEIFEWVNEIASIFNIPAPQVFIVNEIRPNGFSHGIDGRTYVGLTHGLIEQCDETSIRFLLGHEMGHIHCNHVLYLTMIHWLRNNPQIAPNMVTEEMMGTLLAWMRYSELSADRAGLIACGDEDKSCLTLLTLLLGSVKLASRIDIREYVAEQALSLHYNPLALSRQSYESHPFMPFRIAELKKFAGSASYQSIVDRMKPIVIDLN